MSLIKNIGRFFVVFFAAYLISATSAYANNLSVDLTRTGTIRHLENIQRIIRSSLIDNFVDAHYSLDEAGAMAIISHCINSETVTYWLQDIPLQTTKNMALRVISLAYSSITDGIASSIIGSLEQLSVEQASQIASDLLQKNNIQIAGGSLKSSYQDQNKKIQNPDIQYLLTYHPEGTDWGKIVAEFRSPYPVFPPPTTSRTVWDYYSWRTSGQETIPPFIININGYAQEKYGLFEWIDKPAIEISFPATVLDLYIPTNQSIWEHIIDGAINWGQQKINSLGAWLSTLMVGPHSVSSDELDQLKKTVNALEETVEESQISNELSLDQYFSDFIEELMIVATNLADLSEENKNISQEITAIVQYSSEIMKWQAENSIPPVIEESTESTQEEEKDISENNDTICSINSLSPSLNSIIINEIAWMGRTSSTNHEWIELKNISSEKISLSGWQLYNQSQDLMINFEENQFIDPFSFFLLVRADSSYVPEAVADHIYSGAIKNLNEGIYLFNDKCQLQDFAQANPAWESGDNTTKRTMERNSSLAWHTSTFIHGTPRSTNSSGYQINSSYGNGSSSSNTNPIVDNQVPIANAGPDQIVDFNQSIILDASLSSDNIGIVSYKWDIDGDDPFDYQSTENILELPGGILVPGEHLLALQVSDAAGNNGQDELIIIVNEIPEILINEIQFHGETNHDEFIELYNPHDYAINLEAWSLRKKTSGGDESNLVSSSNFSGVINGQDYFLIANPQLREDGEPHYQSEIIPDLYYSGQTYYISSDNTILLYAPDGSLSDKVGCGNVSDYDSNPFPDNPPPEISLGRRWLGEQYADTNNNNLDFEWQFPTPRSQNLSWENEEEQEDSGSEDIEDTLQDGSEEFPFLLSTCPDLLGMNDHLGAYYQLTKDIDCQETATWHEGHGFEPIGLFESSPFVGKLDGQGFSISNLYIGNHENYGGFFARLSYPAHVINLKLEKITIETEGYYIGLLAGNARGSDDDHPVIISNVSVEGSLNTHHYSTNAPQDVGGLIGLGQYIIIDEAHSQIFIEADHKDGHNVSSIGGLFGQINHAKIYNCSSQGSIAGWRNIGGLIGQTGTDIDVQKNYASVDIIGEQILGGFVGITHNTSGILQNNYATGNVTGCSENGQSIGGFAGQSNEWIKYSYARGAVDGKQSYGFIGSKPINRSDPVCDSYYDINTSGRSGKNLGAIGMITTDMFNQNNFPDWDFEEIWQINDNYPTLR